MAMDAVESENLFEVSMKGMADSVKVEGFEPINEYIEQFISLGGKMLVCAPCTEYYCNFENPNGKTSLLPDATLGGLSTVVSMVTPNTSVVTF